MPRCFAPPPFRSFLEQSIDVPSNVGRNGRSRENSSIEIRPGISSCRSNPSERRGTTHRRVTRDRRVFYHESFLIVFLLVFESFLFSRRGFLARARARLLYDANYSIGGTVAGDIGRRWVPVTWPGNHAVRFALEIESKPPLTSRGRLLCQ